MRAIQVKVLPCTQTKPTRLKAWVDGGTSLIETRDTGIPMYTQAKRVAVRLARSELGWHFTLAGGQLPGGDYAFCIQPMRGD